jgi:hypothetical protein
MVHPPAQTPALHAWPTGHTTPHAPQLWESEVVLTQTGFSLAQQVFGAEQAGPPPMQLPLPSQLCPLVQAFPVLQLSPTTTLPQVPPASQTRQGFPGCNVPGP